MNLNYKKITRRHIQTALGVLWLLDGVLQLQRQIFTSSFANNVISPAGQGQPVFVSGPVHYAVQVILLNPAVFNIGFAFIQLAIGACILYKPTAKYGLIGSIVWALSVWYIGEGLGGIASGHASLLMGAPGAALLYAIIALAVMPYRSNKNTPNESPAFWLAFVWLILWLGGAIYQLLPGQDSISNLSSMILGNAANAQSWLASLDTHVASTINGLGSTSISISSMHMTATQLAQMTTKSGSGYWFILLIALLQLAIGVGVLLKGYRRKLALIVGIGLSLVFWVIGQSLGGYYTCLATDPNSAPLFILLAIAILGCTELDQKLSNLYMRIEYALVGKPN